MARREPRSPDRERERIELTSADADDANADGRARDPLDTDPATNDPGDAREARGIAFTQDEIDALSGELCSYMEGELELRKGREQNWIKWQRLYDAEPRESIKSYPIEGSSNLVVPLAAIYSDTIEARIMQSIFGMSPHWTASEINRKFAAAAKPLERWLDWARDNVWSQETVIEPLVKETVKLGTSCLYVGFVNENRLRYDDVTRSTYVASHRYGPAPEWVSIGDTLIPAGYTDVQRSPLFGHRVWLSGDRLRQLEFANYIEGVDRVLGHPSEESELRRMRRDGSGVDASTRSDRYSLYALWNVWFSRDFDRDGYPEEYVAMLNLETRTIMRLRPNPYPSQTRPYVITRYLLREGDFYGVGIPERVEQLQDEASTIHNQRRDAAHLSLITMYIGGAASNLPDTIRPKNGRVIKALNANDLKEFRPSNPTQIAAFEEQFVTMIADRAVGISELSEGKVTSPIGRAAATTVVSLMQEGARRFDRIIAKMRAALDEEAHMIAEAYQTYGLPPPDAPGAPEEVLDPEDAAIVRGILDRQDNLRAFFAIKLNVSTQAVNREVEKQTNVALYGMVIQYAMQVMQFATGVVNPQMPPPLRDVILRILKGVDRAMERILQSHGAFDLDQVLVAEALAQMSAQMGAQAQAAGPMGAQGGPQGAPGAQMLGGPGDAGAAGGNGVLQ